MNPQNTMSPELQQAIAARAQTGVATPQLSQTQGGAPAPMPPATSAPQNPAGAVSGAPQGQAPVNAGPQPGSSEEELITKALIQRQKMLGEFKKNTPQPTLQEMPVS